MIEEPTEPKKPFAFTPSVVEHCLVTSIDRVIANYKRSLSLAADNGDCASLKIEAEDQADFISKLAILFCTQPLYSFFTARNLAALKTSFIHQAKDCSLLLNASYLFYSELAKYKHSTEDMIDWFVDMYGSIQVKDPNKSMIDLETIRLIEISREDLKGLLESNNWLIMLYMIVLTPPRGLVESISLVQTTK